MATRLLPKASSQCFHVDDEEKDEYDEDGDNEAPSLTSLLK